MCIYMPDNQLGFFVIGRWRRFLPPIGTQLGPTETPRYDIVVRYGGLQGGPLIGSP